MIQFGRYDRYGQYLAILLFMGLSSCSLLSEGPDVVMPPDPTDVGASDTGHDADGGEGSGNDAASDADTAGIDMPVTDPLAPPSFETHRIGLVTETNAKFASQLNVLAQFERLVYGEDEIATLANQDGNYPDHDLFLIRTGGVEPLRTTKRPVINFAPWAEDDLLMSPSGTFSNRQIYSTVELLPNDFGIPAGTFDPFTSDQEESWFEKSSEHADGVETLAYPIGVTNAAAIVHAPTGSQDVNGDPFAGPRAGIYLGFHRRDADADFEPAFDIWTTQTWDLYVSFRESMLPDTPDASRRAIFVHDGQTAMGAAVVSTRLNRLGFDVERFDTAGTDQFDASGADLIVLWSGTPGTFSESLPSSVPVLAFNSNEQLMTASGLLETAGSPIRGLEHRWRFEAQEVVPAGRRLEVSEIVNINETTLSLPPADDVLCIPESRIAAGGIVLARLVENDNVTAFIVDDVRRAGYFSLDPNAVARANIEFIQLFDRTVIWLTI